MRGDLPAERGPHGSRTLQLIGGVVMIAISTLLIRWTYPKAWMGSARARVEEASGGGEDDLD